MTVAPPQNPALPTLFLLGDSVALEYGPALARALRQTFSLARKGGMLEAKADLDIPRGANGGDSTSCRMFLRDDELPRSLRPELFMLNCGLHDIKVDLETGDRQVPLDTYEANLRAIIGSAEDLRTTLLWVTTTPVDEAAHNVPDMAFHRHNSDVEAYNAAAKRVMDEASVPVIDLHRFTMSLGSPSDTLRDGRHARPEVQLQQAAYLAGWVESFLLSRR